MGSGRPAGGEVGGWVGPWGGGGGGICASFSCFPYSCYRSAPCFDRHPHPAPWVLSSPHPLPHSGHLPRDRHPLAPPTGHPPTTSWKVKAPAGSRFDTKLPSLVAGFVVSIFLSPVYSVRSCMKKRHTSDGRGRPCSTFHRRGALGETVNKRGPTPLRSVWIQLIFVRLVYSPNTRGANPNIQAKQNQTLLWNQRTFFLVVSPS